MKKYLLIGLIIPFVLISACGNRASKSAEGYWDSANKYFESQDYEKCAQEYRNIFRFYPNDALALKALFAMADVYKNNISNVDSSISIYERIYQKYPDSDKTPNALFMIGYIYANDIKDFEKARASYTRFIQTYPNHTLVPSAQWELENLGKSLDDIPQFEDVPLKNEGTE
jgi:TolA-binding protein